MNHHPCVAECRLVVAEHVLDAGSVDHRDMGRLQAMRAQIGRKTAGKIAVVPLVIAETDQRPSALGFIGGIGKAREDRMRLRVKGIVGWNATPPAVETR